MEVLLLVCAVALSPVDCREDTARIVVEGPDAPNEIACAMQSQAYFAGSRLEISETEYLKISCVRTRPDKADLAKR